MSASESIMRSGVESSDTLLNQVPFTFDEGLSPALLKAVFDVSADGIVVQDARGRIAFVNASAERILQMSADQMMGSTAHDPHWFATTEDGRVVEPKEHPTVYTLRTGEPLSGVVMVVQSSRGTLIHTTVSTRALFLPGHSAPAGVLITFVDITQAKLTEQALTESERRFGGIFEQTLHLISLLDPQGTILEINQPALSFMRQPRVQIVGNQLSESPLWGHDSGVQQQVREAIARAAANSIVRFEAETIGANEQPAIFDVSLKPICDDFGVVVLLLFEARDVTEQKAATAAIRASDQRFHQAFELAPIGKALVGLDGSFFQVNRALCELTGYSEKELLLTTFQEITHPEDLEADLEQASRLLSGEITSYQMEKRYIRRDGSTAWVLLSGTLIRDESGNPGYFIAQVLDVSARKQVEQNLAHERDLLRGLMDSLPDLVFFKDADARFIRVNTVCSEALGLSDPVEAIGKTAFDFLPPALAKSIWESDREVLDHRVPTPDRIEIVEENGAVKWLSVTKAPTYDQSGQLTGLVGISRDVTHRMVMEAALRESEQRFRGAFAHAPVGIALIAFSRHILQVNRKLCDLLGYTESELLACTWMDITHPDDIATGEDLHCRLKAGEIDTFELEKRYLRKDGGTVWAQLTVSLVRDDAGVPLYNISQIQDISERRVIEERLRRMALHDPLTDLPNRTLLSDRLGHALEQVSRRGTQVAVLFLDLDRFKIVNDDLGHSVGDALLCAVTERLSGLLRTGDTLARVSGDEFVIVLEGIRANDDAIEIASRMIEAMGMPFDLSQGTVHIGASIGIAFGTAVDCNAEELLKHADVALYRAKAAGRNQYAIFDQSMSHMAARRHAIERDLRGATERGELELHYQPVIELATGTVTSVEALVRWRHPVHGLIGPMDFIGLAEETGLIVPLGRWVVREACQQLAKWGNQIPSVAVNLSAGQFREIGLVDELAAELANAGIEPHRLIVEITEHVLVVDVAATAATLAALRALGVTVAIDDFGTGYSSLGYLRHLPVDMIKLDRSFVRGLGTDAGSIAIVESIAALAHTLGLTVTAEGIETVEQLAYVRSAGCDRGQGYLFAKPEPASSHCPVSLRGDPVQFDLASGELPYLESLKLLA